MPRTVAVLIADDFSDSGLAVALDVFKAAGSLAARAKRPVPFRTEVASAEGGPVRSASGMVIQNTHPIGWASRADVLLVPGLWVETPAQVDATLGRPDVRRLVKAVAAADARGAIVGSSCSGAFVLADAGVLDGREATATWWLADHLRHRRPQVDVNADAALVVHPRVLCAGAVFAMADLALHLVARFGGPTLAQQCADVLLLDRHSAQTPYMALRQLTTNDPTVRRAERWVRAHLDDDFDIGTLARQVGASPRTLARKLAAAVGLSPIGFVQRLRVEAAVHLVETTRQSLEEISPQVGYADANALRRVMRRHVNTTPRELRRRLAS
jgi:transcriptional regulator GlxA family with amidase domain